MVGMGALLELDPNTHEWEEIVIAVKNNPDNPAVTRFAQDFPVPSAYYGAEALWKRSRVAGEILHFPVRCTRIRKSTLPACDAQTVI